MTPPDSPLTGSRGPDTLLVPCVVQSGFLCDLVSGRPVPIPGNLAGHSQEIA